MNKLTNTVTGVLNFIAITVLVIVAGSCGTHKQMQTGTNAKLHDSLVVDSDGNKYPVKILLDGNLWMTANLNLEISNSYCYDNIKKNCEQYGRLYTWESAIQGCKLLGEGWRLPTNGE